VTNQTAFGGMLHHLVELTSIVLRPVPLDAEIERRYKQAWEQAPCPECEETTSMTIELGHNGWRGYVPLVYEVERIVPHSKTFVTDDGVHVNQVESL